MASRKAAFALALVAPLFLSGAALSQEWQQPGQHTITIFQYPNQDAFEVYGTTPLIVTCVDVEAFQEAPANTYTRFEEANGCVPTFPTNPRLPTEEERIAALLLIPPGLIQQDQSGDSNITPTEGNQNQVQQEPVDESTLTSTGAVQ